MTCNVLLVDDHLLMRAGLRTLVSAIPGYAVVGECSAGSQWLESVQRLAPDIALIDLDMCLGLGLRYLTQVHTAHPGCRILILAVPCDAQLVLQVLQAGAQGFLLKSTGEQELRQALDALRIGERYLSPTVASGVLSEALSMEHRSRNSASQHLRLTPRQLEILRLVARGKSTREMAAGLGLSVKTVETHRSQIMKRLQIFDVAGLVLYAVREGVISLDD